ncbi:Uma2 family endonuclease [Actinosynnema sp. NPDC059797]
MSILEVEMPAALQHPIGPHTVEEWLDLPPSEDGSRTELIYGYLHVSPQPACRHQRVSGRLLRFIEDAVWANDRRDLHVLMEPGVKISSVLRTGLIPDVAVFDRDPEPEVVLPPESLLLVVEVWSPGNTRAEQETKLAAYAMAGVPFLWTLELEDGLELTTHRLVEEQYQVQDVIHVGEPVTIEAAPLPITLDLNRLVSW